MKMRSRSDEGQGGCHLGGRVFLVPFDHSHPNGAWITRQFRNTIRPFRKCDLLPPDNREVLRIAMRPVR
jgi:hypothetical protein